MSKSLQQGNHPPVKSLLLDMDGVIWRGDEPIGDLPKLFNKVYGLGLEVAFITNNATRTADQYIEKLRSFGVHATENQLVTSAQASANYLEKIYPGGGPVFIVGEIGLIHALQEKCFYHNEKEALAVVTALDRDLTYDKLRRANHFIRAGATFISANRDNTLPTPEGEIPGAGSILAALEAASGRKAIVIGKPNPQMYLDALSRLQTDPENALVVGDRMETDIAGGQAIGCQTALVLSGVTKKAEFETSMTAPTYINYDLANLVEELFPSD